MQETYFGDSERHQKNYNYTIDNSITINPSKQTVLGNIFFT